MPSRRVPRPASASWWPRLKDEVMRDLMVALVSGTAAGAVVTIPIFVASARQTEQIAGRQEQLEQRRFEQAEVLENMRFVRDRAAEPGGLKPFTRLNLSGADLARLPLGCPPDDERANCAQMDYADLSGANLEVVDLTGASLDGANLTGAKMLLAILIEADLEGADLSGAHLPMARLTGALLGGTNFEGADLLGADLSATDLSDANLTSANVIGAIFSGADLSGANLTGTGVRPADLEQVCYDAETRWPEGMTPPTPRCDPP